MTHGELLYGLLPSSLGSSNTGRCSAQSYMDHPRPANNLELCSWTVQFSVFTTSHDVNGNRERDLVMILFLCAGLMSRKYGSSRGVSSFKILLEPVVNFIELGVHALDMAFDLTAIAPNARSATTGELDSVNDVRSLVDRRKS